MSEDAKIDVIDRPKVEEDIPEAPPIILRKWHRYMENHLRGDVYGHPRFFDGECIITSRVQFIDETLGIARTLNTTYILRDKA